MPSPDAITIRPATPDDAAQLRRLAELDSRRELRGDVLVAETGGAAIAALSIADGRTLASPFVPSADAVALLRIRAAALAGAVRAPSVRDRLVAALRSGGRPPIYQN